MTYLIWLTNVLQRMFNKELLPKKNTKTKRKSVHNNYMCILKRIRRNWNLELDTFVFFKKHIALVKNCGCKFWMKIADRKSGWSALGPLDAGMLRCSNNVFNLISLYENFKKHDFTTLKFANYCNNKSRFLVLFAFDGITDITDFEITDFFAKINKMSLLLNNAPVIFVRK